MTLSDTFSDHLATPLIIYAEMDEAAFRHEFARMQVRETATADFVAGELELSDYLDVLDDSGVDVDEVWNHWMSGQSFMS
jgi:hypothetical protein